MELMRSKATTPPATPPPIKAISDRHIVQTAPCSRNSKCAYVNPPEIMVSPCSLQTAPAGKHQLAKSPHAYAHQQRQRQVDDGNQNVGLEGTEGLGLHTAGDRRELFDRDLRSDG